MKNKIVVTDKDVFKYVMTPLMKSLNVEKLDNQAKKEVMKLIQEMLGNKVIVDKMKKSMYDELLKKLTLFYRVVEKTKDMRKK